MEKIKANNNSLTLILLLWPLNNLKEMMQKFSFEGRSVNVICGDITRIKADCIVSSDDNYLSMGGGISEAIKLASGSSKVWEETRKFIPSKIASVHATGGGDLPCKFVLHAVVIDWDQDIFPDSDIVKKTLYNALLVADELKCNSISIPALGTGVGRLDSNVCAVTIIETLQLHLRHFENISVVNIVIYEQESLFRVFKVALENKILFDHGYEYRSALEKTRLQAKGRNNRYNLPFQIAYLKKRVSNQIVQHSKFTAFLDFFEHSVVFLSIIVFSVVFKRVNEIEKADLLDFFMSQKASSFGNWDFELRRTLKKYQPLLEEESLTSKIISFYKGEISSLIRKMIKIRNEIKGHGITQTEEYYAHLNSHTMSPRFDLFCDKISFLSDYQLIVVKEIDHLEDQSNKYSYVCKLVSGESFAFDTTTTLTNLNLVKNKMYLVGGNWSKSIMLFPFMLFEHCPSCTMVQPFHLTKITENHCHYAKQVGNHKISRRNFFSDLWKF